MAYHPPETRVRCRINHHIATVTLNRADKKNAFDLVMFNQLAEVQKRLRADRTVRVVIIDHEGDDFSTGLDIRSVMGHPKKGLRLLAKWNPWRPNLAQQVCVGWRKIPCPVIASIRGRCWGAGMQLALGADFRIAHPASELSIMESRWGLMPDMGGSLALRELLPVDQAMKITMLSSSLSAQKAKDLHLITEISEHPQSHSRQLADQLLDRSPDANAAIKRHYHKAWHHNDRTQLAREWLSQLKILLAPNQAIATKRQSKHAKSLAFSNRHWWF